MSNKPLEAVHYSSFPPIWRHFSVWTQTAINCGKITLNTCLGLASFFNQCCVLEIFFVSIVSLSPLSWMLVKVSFLKSVPEPQGLWPLSLSLTSSAHSLWLICSCPAAVTPFLPPSHFPAAPSSKATRNVTAGRRTSPFIKRAHWALLLIAGNLWCVDLVPRSIKELKIDSHLTYVGVNVSWLNGTINGLVLQVQCWNRCGLVTFDNVRFCS